MVDEVSVYSSALSTTDVQDAMNGIVCTDAEEMLYWNFDDQPSIEVLDQFNFFDGIINGGSNVLNEELEFGELSARIITPPANGSASLTDDFVLSYTPTPGFAGIDSLTYELSIGQCDLSLGTVILEVNPVANTPDCNGTSLDLTGLISSNTTEYYSDFVIGSSGLIFESNTDAGYKAQNFIELQMNTEVRLGARLILDIATCEE